MTQSFHYLYIYYVCQKVDQKNKTFRKLLNAKILFQKKSQTISSNVLPTVRIERLEFDPDNKVVRGEPSDDESD